MLYTFTVLSFILTLSIGGSSGETAEVLKFLPHEMQGWKVEERAETFDQETIYDYMDGAAEIYLAYDFKRLLVKRYKKYRGPGITVEMFDMGSSEDAFGVFSHGQGRSKEIGIGQGSEYRSGLLCFWKGRFFVCILAERETPSSKRAILSLGRAISKGIKEEGRMPLLLNYLPEKSLVKKSIRFFHSHTILNYHYFVADRDILNLDASAKAVLAQYSDGSHLLLAQYEDSEKAASAFKSFKEVYMPDAVESGSTKTENQRWTAARQEGKIVIIIFDAADEAGALSRIESVMRRLR